MPDQSERPQIHELVCNGNTEEIAALVARGADINEIDGKFKFTPLHWAAHHGALECMHWLLWHGADHAIQTPEGWTPAHISAIRGQDSCMQALSANGAEMNTRDNKGKTTAHLAAAHGNSATMLTIFRKGVDINAVDNVGWAVAHAAAYHGRLACLQLIVKWGGKLDLIDQEGNIPAHLAASEGHTHCLKFLVCAAASASSVLNARNDQGETPKDAAQRYMKDECVDYLNAIEFDLQHPETSENLAYPGHVSAAKGDLAYLQMLVDTGVVNVNERDDSGSTPAHKACGNGKIPVLKWLIEEGANMLLLNNAGETPRDVACRFGHLACAKLLGDDIEIDADGDPVVMLQDESRLDLMLGKNSGPEQKAEAKARALRKVEELTNQLEIAKLNYRQFGGELKEDVYKREMEENKVRVTAELDAQLEYERERREKLESKIDVLRSQVHNFTKQLKESANKNMHISRENEALRKTIKEIGDKSSRPSTSVTRKKKKTKPKAGVFVVRGVADHGPPSSYDEHVVSRPSTSKATSKESSRVNSARSTSSVDISSTNDKKLSSPLVNKPTKSAVQSHNQDDIKREEKEAVSEKSELSSGSSSESDSEQLLSKVKNKIGSIFT